MNNKRWWTIGTAVVALGGAVLLSAAPEAGSEGSGTSVDRVRRVEVQTVEQVATSRAVRLSGMTRAVKRNRVSFTLPGRIEARPIEVGDRVERGSLLARLDARNFGHAVTAAEASLAELTTRRAQVDRDLARAERLYEAKAATVEEVEQTRAAADGLAAGLAAAEARLSEARRQLSETAVRATGAGVVTAVHLEPGEYAQPGAPIAEIAYDGPVEIEIEVPEALLEALAPGTTLPVRLPLAGRELTGQVDSVAGAAPGRGGLFPARVRLERGTDAGVLPGMTAEVEVTAGQGSWPSVPVGAVINPGGSRPSLFKLVGDRVERVRIELGTLVGSRITVRAVDATLEAGDEVVTAGQTRLADGDRVEVAR